MVPWLDSTISIHSLIWLFLAAFMLHDFEEIIRIEPFFRKHRDSILKRLPTRLHEDFRTLADTTAAQFAVAVCIEFITFIPITFLAAEASMYLPFLGINIILLLHVFMHIGQSIFVCRPVPGVFTAVMITLPYSLYLLYRLLDSQLIDMKDIWLSLPFGLLLIPILLIGHKAGEKLVPTSN